MSTVRNILYVGTGTGVRLAFGVLNFVVLPRMMGPENFSIFMFWFAVATLIAMVTNFGFPTYVLREGCAAPERLHKLMGEALTANLLISAVVLAICVAAIPFLPHHHRGVFLVLVVAKLADSACELINVGYRVTNRFDTETRIGVTSTFCQLPLTALALYVSPEPISGAWALLLVRAAVLAVTVRSLTGYLHGVHLGAPRVALGHFRAATAYAVDYGMQNLFGQVDSVVLAHYLGVSVVGVYQAGMRLFMGAAQGIFVLGTVFLPTATVAYASGQGARKVLNQLQASFLAIGVAGCLGFIFLAKPITAILFGEKFAGLAELLPTFGLLFFVRTFSATWGVALTVIGKQVLRTKLAAMHWALILVLSAFLVPAWGSQGWLISLIVGNLFLGLGYFAFCCESRAEVPIRSAVYLSGGAMALVGSALALRFY